MSELGIKESLWDRSMVKERVRLMSRFRIGINHNWEKSFDFVGGESLDGLVGGLMFLVV